MEIESPHRGERDGPADADITTLISPYARKPVQTLLALLSLVCCVALLWRCGVAGSAGGIPRTLPAGNNFSHRLVIDLNSATAKELSLLPGVGPVLATRIVENRQREGPFRSVEDLARVNGIGPRKLDQLRFWCVTPADSTSVIRSARRP